MYRIVNDKYILKRKKIFNLNFDIVYVFFNMFVMKKLKIIFKNFFKLVNKFLI